MQLTGNNLTIQVLKDVLKSKTKITLAPEAISRMEQSRASVEKIIQEGRTVYGITTGFGSFCNIKISQEETKVLQQNLIRSHSTGVGEPFEDDIVKLMLILRANALAKGHSGVRVELVQRLLLFVNEEIYPFVPAQGSLGASGDLVQLAHIGLALIGEGQVRYQGEILPSSEVHERLQITPITLEAKEGLGLINGTQAMTAVGVKTMIELERLLECSIASSSLAFQALNGIVDVFDLEPHLARGFSTQVEAARNMSNHLKGSKFVTKQGEQRVQDAYSLRCIPQVLGAIYSAVDYTKTQLEIELNAATDNPLIFDDGEKVISGGNFHGEPIAFAMDFLKLPIAELANITERRIERLINPALNNSLPAFLSNHIGLDSGTMILQYTAASLVSENKVLAHPASVDSIPSSGNQEDHVSMGTIAARQAYEMLRNTEQVLAIECFVAAQAIHIQGSEGLSEQSKRFYSAYRSHVTPYEHDRVFSVDIQKTVQFLREWKQ